MPSPRPASAAPATTGRANWVKRSRGARHPRRRATRRSRPVGRTSRWRDRTPERRHGAATAARRDRRSARRRRRPATSRRRAGRAILGHLRPRRPDGTGQPTSWTRSPLALAGAWATSSGPNCRGPAGELEQHAVGVAEVHRAHEHAVVHLRGDGRLAVVVVQHRAHGDALVLAASARTRRTCRPARRRRRGSSSRGRRRCCRRRASRRPRRSRAPPPARPGTRRTPASRRCRSRRRSAAPPPGISSVLISGMPSTLV